MVNYLQNERKRIGLTAARVCEKLDVGRSTYTRWEAGAPIPSDKLAALAELGFDVNYVVTGQQYGKLTVQTNIDKDSAHYKEGFERLLPNDDKPKLDMPDFHFCMQQICKLRDQQLSDKDLALILDLNLNTFYTWKRNNKVPYKELTAFCIEFSVNLNWLFTGVGQPYLAAQNTSAQVQPAAKSIDSQRLTDSIEIVLGAMEDADTELSLNKVAKIIALVYDELSSGEKITPKQIAWFTKLAS